MRLASLGRIIAGFVILSAGMAPPAQARQVRQVRWYRHLDSPARPGDPELAARAFLVHHAARLELTKVELAPTARVLPWRQEHVVRIGQEYEGLPVFGRTVIVRVDGNGRVRTVTTNARGDLDLVTQPLVSAREAFLAAAKAWDVPAQRAAVATLGVEPEMDRNGALVWRVDGAIKLRGTRTWVDAVTGQVRGQIWRVWSAQADVYLDNPVATPTLSRIDLPYLPTDATSLSGNYLSAYRYVDGALNQQNPQMSDWTLEQTALADANGDFLFVPTTDASQPVYDEPFAEVSVYYHVNRIYTYFREQHGYSTTKTYSAIANYGDSPDTPYDNAFFTPVGASDYVMCMGQGTHGDLGYDGDVIYHEFTHSVIDNIAQMTTQMQMFDEWGVNTGPGALHEGLADYFSSTLTGDSVMGEYSLNSIEAGATRDLADLKVCPSDVWGEVHDDGRVVGSTNWAMRQALGDVAAADDIVYGSLSLQTSRPTFQDFAEGMRDTAEAMLADGTLTQTQLDAVITALTDHGMLSCGRDINLEPGPRETGILFNFAAVAAMLTQYGTPMTCEEARTANLPIINVPFPAIPANFQFRRHVDADASAVSFTVRFTPDTDLQYWIYVRRGHMVHFHTQDMYGMLTLVEPDQYDHVFGPLDAGEHTVTIDLQSDPALQPGEDYYLAITQKNCTTLLGQPARQTLEVSAEVDTTPPTPDAGVEPDATVDATPDGGTTGPSGKKGCGCATQDGSAPTTPLLALLLGLLGLAWRRRRAA